MPLNIRSAEVTRLAALLAARARVNKTEAVRRTLENELRRIVGLQVTAIGLPLEPVAPLIGAGQKM